MTDLVKRASEYATQAHQRINHLRKYSKQPYHVHLEAVARLVASVTDDPEVIAAAWLHDTVEDTSATLDDIEAEFGKSIADLVEELTDVSKPSDGNRAVRKEIDRTHSAQASSRAKTVKLADLIDNCKDIAKHDPRFARIYLAEMAQLLDVLTAGDASLMNRARKVHQTSIEKLGIEVMPVPEPPIWLEGESLPGFAGPHFRRMFTELFTAGDIAEPLLSFDAGQSCADAARVLDMYKQDVASVRINGTVQGYIRRTDLSETTCTEQIRQFTVDQVVSGNTSLTDVVHILTRHDFCFVSVLGEVTGLIQRDDINKPMVRMWLFGLVTMIEMMLVQLIQQYYPKNSWQDRVSEARLSRAKEFQAERQRRNQHCSLIECLQFSDKGRILVGHEQAMARLGFNSIRVAKRAVKELESLRNNLSHAQDIVTHDWAQIARLSQRMEGIPRR